jgi:polyisoprenoid-binding protein YceI
MKSLFAAMLFSCIVAAQARPIDTAKSTITVFAYKSGLFSFAAHDHEVAAPIASGTIDQSAGPSVALKIDARKMKVLDPKVSNKDRAEIQQTMLSEKVLHATRYPEIAFTSTSIRPAGRKKWTVTGNLTLHGHTRPVTMEVIQQYENFVGTATIKQRDFGIAPISLGGGTIKVKDEVKIQFQVATASP